LNNCIPLGTVVLGMAKEKESKEPKASAVKACSFIEGLTGGSPALWEDFRNEITGLIDSDLALRRDLAHLLLYLVVSPANIGPGRPKLPISGAFRAYMIVIAGEIRRLTEIPWPPVSDAQKCSKFVERSSGYHEDAEFYTVYILLLIGVTIEEGEKFTKHHVFEEIGDLKDLILSLAACAKVGASVSALIECAREFKARRVAWDRIKPDLGAFIELGTFGWMNLWPDVFRASSSNHDKYRERKSIENRYICYRFSSLNGGSRITKSFVVFQSPGEKRRHFAFKVFYRSREEKLRRSAGALIEMGESIVCLGSSREISEGAEQSVRATGFVQSVRGPKALVFDARQMRTQPMIVMGLTLTVNEGEVPIVSRICMVRTNHAHSSSAGIGSIRAGSLASDLRKHTVFGSDEKWRELNKPGQMRPLADKIAASLQIPAERGLLRLDDMEQIDPHAFI
jgi:hypothetical protein